MVSIVEKGQKDLRTFKTVALHWTRESPKVGTRKTIGGGKNKLEYFLSIMVKI